MCPENAGQPSTARRGPRSPRATRTAAPPARTTSGVHPLLRSRPQTVATNHRPCPLTAGTRPPVFSQQIKGAARRCASSLRPPLDPGASTGARCRSKGRLRTAPHHRAIPHPRNTHAHSPSQPDSAAPRAQRSQPRTFLMRQRREAPGPIDMRQQAVPAAATVLTRVTPCMIVSLAVEPRA
jgi:hypothetical protein